MNSPKGITSLLWTDSLIRFVTKHAEEVAWSFVAIILTLHLTCIPWIAYRLYRQVSTYKTNWQKED